MTISLAKGISKVKFLTTNYILKIKSIGLFFCFVCILPTSNSQEVELVTDFNTYGSAFYNLVAHNGWLYWLHTGRGATDVMAWDRVNEPIVLQELTWEAHWFSDGPEYIIPYRNGVLFFNDVGTFADLSLPYLAPYSFFDPSTRKVDSLPAMPRDDFVSGHLDPPKILIGDDLYFEGRSYSMLKYTFGDDDWSTVEFQDISEVENASLNPDVAVYSSYLGLIDGTYKWNPESLYEAIYTNPNLEGFLQSIPIDTSRPSDYWQWGLTYIPPECTPKTFLADGAQSWKFLGTSDTGEVYLLKRAFENTDPGEIWVTDGSTNGTRKLLTLHGPISFAGHPGGVSHIELKEKNFKSNGDWVVMAMELGDYDWELFISDGTPENTEIVDLVPGPYGSYPHYFMFFGDDVYFRGGNTEREWCIWRYNISSKVAEIVYENAFFGAPDSDFANFAPTENGFYFDMWTNETGEALFFFDVNDRSVELALSMDSPNWDSHPRNLKVMGNDLFFSASKDWLPYRELYKYSADTNKIELVLDNLRDESSTEQNTLSYRWGKTFNYDYFEIEPEKMLFGAFSDDTDDQGNTYRFQLFATDGTSEGTYPLELGWVEADQWFDGRLYRRFRRQGEEYIEFADPQQQDLGKRWLAKLSGWPIQLEYLHYLDYYQMQDKQLTDMIYASAGENIIRIELSHYTQIISVYSVNLDDTGDKLLAQLSFAPDPRVIPIGPDVYDSHNEHNGFHYILVKDKIIVTDGTPEGTAIHNLMGDNQENRYCERRLRPLVFDDFLYFFTNGTRVTEDLGSVWEGIILYEYDLRTNSSRMVLDRNRIGELSLQPNTLFRDGFVFGTTLGEFDDTLWFLKPGMDEPRMIGTFKRDGPAWCAVHNLTVVDDLLYFSVGKPDYYPEVYEQDDDLELWVTDGHVGQYKQIADIFPGEPGSNPANLCEYDETLYFTAIHPKYGRELMRIVQPPAPWFGIRDEISGSEWIDHKQHGMIQLNETNENEVWVYDSEQGWFWTNRDLYSTTDICCYLYSMKLENWVYYVRDGTIGGSWIYDYNTTSWNSISGF